MKKKALTITLIVIGIILVIASCALVIWMISPAQLEKWEEKKEYEEGINYLNRGHYLEAINSLKGAEYKDSKAKFQEASRIIHDERDNLHENLSVRLYEETEAGSLNGRTFEEASDYMAIVFVDNFAHSGKYDLINGSGYFRYKEGDLFVYAEFTYMKAIGEDDSRVKITFITHDEDDLAEPEHKGPAYGSGSTSDAGSLPSKVESYIKPNKPDKTVKDYYDDPEELYGEHPEEFDDIDDAEEFWEDNEW